MIAEPSTRELEQLIKDPVTRVLLQHDDRIARLEFLARAAIGVGGSVVAMLGAILVVLLEKL